MSAAPAGRPPRSLLFVGAHTLSSNIVGIVIAFVTGVFVTRLFAPGEKGAYNLLLATTELMIMVFGLSLNSGVLYTIASGRAAAGALLSRLMVIAVPQVLLVAGFLSMISLTPLRSALLPAEFDASIIVVVAMFTISLFQGYGRIILTAIGQIPRSNLIDLAIRSTLLGAMLVCWIAVLPLTGEAAVMYLIGTHLLALGIALIVSYSSVRHILLATHTGAAALPLTMTYAMTSFVANLAQFLSYRLDVFFVAHFAGVTQLGIYTLAVGLAQMLWLLANAIAQVLLPHVAASGEGIIRDTAAASRIACMASVVTALMLALCGGWLVPLIYGQTFAAAVRPLLILLPGVTLFAVVTVLAAYLSGIGKPHLNLRASLAGLVVTIFLDLLLIPRFGIDGAAIASTCSYVVTFCIIVWTYVQQTGERVSHLLVPQHEDLVLVRRLLVSFRQRLRRQRTNT